MNKKVNFFCQIFGWRVMAHSVLMLYFSPGFLYGMSTHGYINSQRIERARERAEQDAIARGKTGLEVRSAGRAAAKQEMAQIAIEREELQARQQSFEKKEKKEKKEEEKEPEVLISEKSVPEIQQKKQNNSKRQQARIVSPEERKWAARYDGQQEQRFLVPDKFDGEITARFGNYLVAWDEKNKKDRVLLCNSPTSCSLETKDTIYVYGLEGDTWILLGNLDK